MHTMRKTIRAKVRVFKTLSLNACRLKAHRDILRRHMQVHDERRPPPTSRKKSCVSCIKCEGNPSVRSDRLLRSG
jgi:hypothetical protein